MSYEDDILPEPSSSDPLNAWPTFAQAVRARLEAGRAAYGDRSFSADPAALLAELQQEALDLAGWGYVLFQRLEAMQAALPAPAPAVRLVGADRGER